MFSVSHRKEGKKEKELVCTAGLDPHQRHPSSIPSPIPIPKENESQTSAARTVYRAPGKSMYFLLSRTQAGPGRAVKQEQEEISRNYAQTFSGCSVDTRETEIMVGRPTWSGLSIALACLPFLCQQRRHAGRRLNRFKLDPEAEIIAKPAAGSARIRTIFTPTANSASK